MPEVAGMGIRMKAYRYTLCHCSGVIEKITVPTLWDPFEVAKKMPHTMVFLHVHTKWTVYTKTRWVEGPAFVLVGGPGLQGVTEDTMYAIPQVPLVDDRAAMHCYKNREE